MKKYLERLKGKDRMESYENYFILAIIAGVAMLSIGIGLTIFSARGFTVILAMMGAVVSFLSTIGLIAVWVAREFKEA
ncbi:MAG: hypothetical protein HYT70_00785 [Candidatus Aenigmarchaeota archaeon]|nr:hypothetical protein [Candidatus Aenigmarchaeota archaeon]